MALSNIFKIHSLCSRPAASPELDPGNDYIGAITSSSLTNNAQQQTIVPAGDIFATTGYLSFTSVDLNITSTLAGKILDLVGVGGACFDGTDVLDIYVAQYACSGPLPGAVHRRYTVSKGILHLASLACQHQGNLEASLTMRAVFDGASAPVVTTDDVALPSDTLLGDLTAQWTLSEPADNTVNGQDVGSKRSVNLDFGVQTSTQGADSDPFDSFASIDQAVPVLTSQGVTPLWFDSDDSQTAGDKLGLGLEGKTVTHANTGFAFRKRDAGSFVAGNVAEHITLTMHGIAYFDQLLNASGTDAATMGLRIFGLKDGSGNAPLIFDTASTLPSA